MAKSKTSKGGNPSVPHKHLHSRLSYLHQAATFLATAEQAHMLNEGHETRFSSDQVASGLRADNRHGSETIRLLSNLRGVSRKTQIRLAPRVKHTMCKRCDALLIPGKSSNKAIVNPSKNGAKSWADLFEVQCNQCGTIKRFPVGAMNQKEPGSKHQAEWEPQRDPL
ncbi:uncharacterized protein A1O9_02787 [Exophiala aquamarina CBS 119918]|uniref:Uncharacterized protein n=1 Tax=Exophiala aquamarina CBS 119918 TaxID=1182545 RepID=A0A072PN97_9EURO|nr:uncharacterized protein A1O9_02787 [Exophiala aquamarina CBS 119918]KEF61222.1 hypothetical protein A1O9_02787 [Exophiala aquamarina CBS 119918]